MVGTFLVLFSNGWKLGAAEPVTLRAGGLSALVDPDFPRVIEYRLEHVGVLEGQRPAGGGVEFNGSNEACQVRFQARGAAAAEYELVLPGPRVEIGLRVEVRPEMVEWSVTGVRERGDVKALTLAFPGQALLTVRSEQPDAALAAVHATCRNDRHQGEFRERIGALAAQAAGADDGNYFFASAGGVAGGIAANNAVDIERTAWRIDEAGGGKTITAWCPNWLRREPGRAEEDLRVVRVFMTGDRNGDGRATWQDAALVYRAHMPKPLGHEFVRTTVAENIAMNFASGAQQPFLRILDHVKKTYLATDGLGQQVVIKGFSAEGHDSANTDYGGHFNERAGGLRDLNVLLERARDYQARIGLHINASEVYPEAHRYRPEILQRDANGNPKPGWAWLDHAHMIDKRKDLDSGQLFAALEQMRRELPRLDFVYVDTYWEHGWPAWMIARKLGELGLAMYTEGDLPLDPWTTWAHWRGGGSVIERFIWFSHRDLFSNDALLRGGRGDNDGFLGWQNQHSFHSHIRSTFSRHLPAKYLKHFELLRWEPGVEAVFSDGVRVAKVGNDVTCTQSGRLVMAWTGGGEDTRLLVPWGGKLYAWDPSGRTNRWELPPDWRGRGVVYRYALSDQGRGAEVRIPVTDGGIALALEKGVSYVLYPAAAPAQRPLAWGEGGPVRDPGFDSHGFEAWKVSPAGADVRSENDARGNTRAVVGPPAAELTQTITGLQAGRTYAASLWALAAGARRLEIVVRPRGGAAVTNYAERFAVRHSAPNDPRTGTMYQRLKVLFDLPAGAESAELTLRAAAGAGGAEFDDVRVVPARRPAGGHWFAEDFESVDMGYGPFTCCPGERTHLAEANPPHTQDTINGRFSLKTRDGGRYVRTIPATLRFRPNTRYRLSLETLTSPGGGGRITLESRGRVVWEQKVAAGRGQVTGEFATRNDTESFLSLYREGGDWLTVDDLVIDELGPAPVVAEEAAVALPGLPGRAILLDQTFSGPLGPEWKVILSPKPGMRVQGGADGVRVDAAANVSALVERELPAGVGAVECRMITEGDHGQTWGGGLCAIWPGGQRLRVNLRAPDRKFGVDSTAGGQVIAGRAEGDEFLFRICCEADAVRAEAREIPDGDWQELARFPRDRFPGTPVRVRLGKMHAVEGTGDHTDPGSPGTVRFVSWRAYGGP